MANKKKVKLSKKAEKIKVLLLDVDGILTSGLVHIFEGASFILLVSTMDMG